MAIQSFTGLQAWQAAHTLVLRIYQLTKQFPKEEQFGLSNQIRRASVSVSSNIAEGFSRRYPKEKLRFYYIALSSLTEVQNQILIARDVEYISSDRFQGVAQQSIHVSKLINGLIKMLKIKATVTPQPLTP